jgi:hypothetical protein
MNLEGAVEEGQPPANKATTSAKFCKYCGQLGHITKRSKKYTAQESVVKRFHNEDGTLLSEQATQAPMGAAVEPESLLAEALLVQCNCDLMELLPFVAEDKSEPEQLAALLLMDYGCKDDDSVLLAGGAI